jgi:membrane protease subunit HflC
MISLKNLTSSLPPATPYIAVALVVFILFFVNSAIFVINQTQQALVLQFGQFRKVYQEPGLKFKIPFIQEVLIYENRVLDVDLPPIQVTTLDQKRLEVDTYTRYRISDPLKFFQSIQPATEAGAKMRLEVIITSSMRNVLGKVNLTTLLKPSREKVMHDIQAEIRTVIEPLGIDIVDVRIVRAELPIENRKAVFARMNADLERFAKGNRANGEEVAQTVRSKADRDRVIILAQAQKQSDILKGEGDAKAIQIVTQASSKDMSFYLFYRNLLSYRKVFKPGTKIFLSMDSPYFHNLSGVNLGERSRDSNVTKHGFTSAMKESRK